MAIRKNENVVVRRIHGSFFLIDISDNYSGDKCAIYEINETGLFLWGRIDGTRDADQLAALWQAALADQVDAQLLRDDVDAFIHSLADRHFVEV